jgi:protein-S-isoprenylcysteine O-methyltransferase Ste14
MKSKLQSPLGLNAGGVGPKMIKITLPVIALAIILGIYFPDFVTIPVLNSGIRIISGIFTITAGILVYIFAIARFMKAFSRGQLAINGVYAISRNPIYASWIVLILPSIALFANNWMFFIASLTMYLAFIATIKHEEESLAKVFGQEYLEYKRKVKALFLF